MKVFLKMDEAGILIQRSMMLVKKKKTKYKKTVTSLHSQNNPILGQRFLRCVVLSQAAIKTILVLTCFGI